MGKILTPVGLYWYEEPSCDTNVVVRVDILIAAVRESGPDHKQRELQPVNVEVAPIILDNVRGT